MNNNEGYVFGLDIGTRSIVGTVGYRVGTERFVVVAQESIEHTTRAVIDGQIHDISTVAKTIAEVKSRLENRIHQSLYDVNIAAAGRVLKTKQIHAVHEFPTETKVTEEHIRSLDMLGIEKAYEEIRKEAEDKEKHFFCVGYSIVKYFLNGYPMEMIKMHTANAIEVELIATFLPEEVVDGLYNAVEEAGLHVAGLTLEPIAAINVAIPEKFRLLNIALVDVGAGTSDISVVKEGSIIAFGMIPLAGDEVTEAIAQNYLTDFETAERVKRQCERRKSVSFRNIFGENIRVTKDDIAEVCEEAVDGITKNIATRIKELNGKKTVSAVFVVGGGGKHRGFTEKLAEYLELPENRVVIRGAEVLTQVEFLQEKIRKDSTLVTPIGICMNYYEQNNNFIHVLVNEQRVKLYDNGKVTVLDACVSFGLSQTDLFPARGEALHYFVNGSERVEKGKTGEPAVVKKNGKEVSLNESVAENDEISIRPSTKGEAASLSLSDIPECGEELTITLFGKKVLCPKLIERNGELAGTFTKIQDQDKIEIFDYYTVSGVLEFAGLEKEDMVLLNGQEAGMTAKVKDGDVITAVPKPVKEKKEPKKTPEEKVEEKLEEDPLLQPLKPLPEWMEGVPFDTAKLGADGKKIPGTMENNAGTTPAAEAPPAEAPAVQIQVTVNGTAVTMPKKAKPIFVDVFDVYPFDMSKAGGSRLITRINGVDKDFTEPLQEGDQIELFWEK
ncbi:MAG: rod shape-determining protein [Lachnospiraceae bacterium]|nr:rod shape-determining protein [Lachnospiraceae bacterium]